MPENSKLSPAAKNRLRILFRALVSAAWAFPLSGLTKGLIEFDQNNFLFRDAYSKNLPEFIMGSFRFGVLTLVHGGFPPDYKDPAHPINMYPYIVPTGLILFFLLSRGWRSFEWRRHQ